MHNYFLPTKLGTGHGKGKIVTELTGRYHVGAKRSGKSFSLLPEIPTPHRSRPRAVLKVVKAKIALSQSQPPVTSPNPSSNQTAVLRFFI